MNQTKNPVIVIPARLAATRFPDKPLADLHGVPMIVQVWQRAIEADIGPVLVACGDVEIAEVIKSVGGNAFLTDPDLPSGSDRVHKALTVFDPDGRYNLVINLQGDLPTINPALISASLKPFDDLKVDITTLAAEITDQRERADKNVVKVVLSFPSETSDIGRALYFSRAMVPFNSVGPHYHHIGVYGFKRNILDKFVSLPESRLESLEKLEQLRALEAGMRIDVALVDTVPIGVDTPADLDRARACLAAGSA